VPCSAVQQLRLPDHTGHLQALSLDRADLLPGPRLSRRGPGAWASWRFNQGATRSIEGEEHGRY
jgi:hypothetical protein